MTELSRRFDLAVVGAGALGLAAAVRAAACGLAVVVIERDVPGGDTRALARLDTFPGHPVGLSGEEYVARSVAQAIRFGATVATGCSADSVDCDGDRRLVRLVDGRAIRATAVVAATGAERRLPALPGLREFRGAGIFETISANAVHSLSGEDVFILGPGGLAAPAALSLAAHCRTVTLLAGRRVRAEFPALHRHANVVVRAGMRLSAVIGVDHLETLMLESLRTGRVITRRAAALFILAPGRPRGSWLRGAAAACRSGAVYTGGEVLAQPTSSSPWPLARRPFGLETSLPGVFAVGEARRGGAQGSDGILEALAVVGQVAGYLRAPAVVHLELAQGCGTPGGPDSRAQPCRRLELTGRGVPGLPAARSAG